MFSDHQIARSLTHRYLVALLLVGLLATAAWLSLQLVISEQDSNAAIVNVSGRQRMLSQRTALFSTLLVNASPAQREAARSQLQQAAALMKKSHLGLLHGSEEMNLPPTMSEAMRVIYYTAPLQLNQQVEDYLAHIDALLATPAAQLQPDDPNLAAIIASAPGELVKSLDLAVTQYQHEGEAAIKRLLRAETIVWLLTLLLLALEANFIFRPISQQIRLFIGKLEQAAANLRQTKEELEQRVQERTAELERMAHYDPLTGIPNRRMLADQLSQAIARAKRHGQSLALCYLDLDGFKPINDQYGHATGDLLLIEIARRLKQVLRAEDTLARLGGDEFVMILADLDDTHEIDAILVRILNTIHANLRLGDNDIQVSASIGVTLYPHDAADPDTLLRHADQAMYAAKESGRNRYQLFDPEHDRRRQNERDLLLRLGEALAHREFEMFYQPKVDLADGRVLGAEALIRWRHPERGLVPPLEFLPLLDGSPLEIELGEWVIETVLQQIGEWQEAGLTLTVSANVSANHLLQPNFAARLQTLLARYPALRPESLELEVLETAALTDIERAVNTLNRCREMGVGFSLDDFGTGYSSLDYFRSLPVETLKIDQSFVRAMLEDPDDLGLIEGVIHMAQAFNRKVIAEGVETLEHGALLMHLGCTQAQGYGIARPMPASQFVGWAGKWQAEAVWKGLRQPYLNAPDVTLQAAERSHGQWINQIIALLHAPADATPFSLDSAHCRFGRWYRGSGTARYGTYSAFRDIAVLHESVHIVATGLVALANNGLAEDARAGLSQLLVTRDQLIDKIRELSTQVQQSTGKASAGT